MKRYVIGFLFDTGYIALIQKNRPDWQKGLLNGVGGHIENGETAKQAMFREFKEEAGCDGLDWREFCLMRGSDWEVHCFTAKNNGKYIKTMTDEPVKWYLLDRLPTNLIPNLHWLIPMANYNIFTIKAEVIYED